MLLFKVTGFCRSIKNANSFQFEVVEGRVFRESKGIFLEEAVFEVEEELIQWRRS